MKKIALLLIAFSICAVQLHAQWQQTSGPGGASVSCLLTDGTNLYAGLDLGGGVYKSIDNGETWSQTSLKDKSVSDFLKDGNRIFAATDGGIYISTNNGNSWSLSNTGIVPFYNTCFTKAGNQIFTGTNQGIYLTADNGASWSNASAGLPVNCSIESLYTYGNRIFAGTGNGLFVSDDQGVSWVHYANNATSAEITNENTVYDFMESQNLLFAAAGLGLYYSDNNGDNWTLCDGLPLNLPVYSLTSHNGILYAGTVLHGMYTSPDNGASWTPTNNDNRMVKMNDLIVHDDEIFTGTNVKGIFKTASSGSAWQMANNGIIQTNVSYMTGNATTIFAGSTGYNVFRSQDEGNTWEPLVFGINIFIHALEVVDNKVFLGTEGGLYVSADNGDTWNAVNGMSGIVVNSIVRVNSKLYAATFDGVFVSDDDGVSWSLMSTGLPDEWIVSIVSAGSFLFVTTDEGDIYRSEDDAVSWELYNGNIPGNVRFLKYIDSRLIASTASGIWFSDNLGQTWSTPINPWQLGIPFTIESYGSRLFFGNYNGAFASADNGVNWVAINDGLPVYPQMQVFYKRGDVLFAGTSTKGIWKRDFSNITVSVDETMFDRAVLYPNPFSGQAELKFGQQVNARIQICDVSGKVLRSEIFSGNSFLLKQGNLQGGTYFLNVQSDKEMVSYTFVIH